MKMPTEPSEKDCGVVFEKWFGPLLEALYEIDETKEEQVRLEWLNRMRDLPASIPADDMILSFCESVAAVLKKGTS